MKYILIIFLILITINCRRDADEEPPNWNKKKREERSLYEYHDCCGKVMEYCEALCEEASDEEACEKVDEKIQKFLKKNKYCVDYYDWVEKEDKKSRKAHLPRTFYKCWGAIDERYHGRNEYYDDIIESNAFCSGADDKETP